ncbi:MAG: hypothetical protein KVP17_004801 [Porospora cf. gigantea B]|uniref:uncharacterized protein n=2 Tax=Porospora cf. gigantea B TaxID=2853592 RepID=UPI003571D073|nr:MAG: hypothetical protein KVP17_004801 [Porospora cf. gigantea B]
MTEDYDSRQQDFHADKSVELVAPATASKVELVISSPQNNNSLAGKAQVVTLSGPYTTFLLSGNVDDFNFSVRKRYSDFVWLRQRLQESYPGTLIPPLPAKQKMGRFTDEFIEHRRHQLELFLVRFLAIPSIALTGVTRSWLVTPCFSMGDLKSTYPATRSSVIRTGFEQFQEFVLKPNDRPHLASLRKGPPHLSTTMPSLLACRSYLLQYESYLTEMRKQLKDGIIKAQKELTAQLLAVTQTSNNLHSVLVDMVTRFKVRGVELRFADLEPIVSQRVPKLQNEQVSWSTILQSVLEALCEVSAMLEALESLTDLIKDYEELSVAPSRRESTVEGVIRQATVNFKSWWEDKAQLDVNAVKLVDLECLREWCLLAADFFVEVELPRFSNAMNLKLGRFDLCFEVEQAL